jgi:hypothetical protein
MFKQKCDCLDSPRQNFSGEAKLEGQSNGTEFEQSSGAKKDKFTSIAGYRSSNIRSDFSCLKRSHKRLRFPEPLHSFFLSFLIRFIPFYFFSFYLSAGSEVSCLRLIGGNVGSTVTSGV